MAHLTLSDGARLFYKDWGPKDAQPIVFHHGWPLSADDWDNQMLFFLDKGFRVIAHDRRGHGRSDQTDTGNDMDTYAADVAELAEALDLKNAVHIGHSTGGGEAIRYVARSRPGRVAKAVLIGAVPPIMLATPEYPGGLPMAVFDGLAPRLRRDLAQAAVLGWDLTQSWLIGQLQQAGVHKVELSSPDADIRIHSTQAVRLTDVQLTFAGRDR